MKSYQYSTIGQFHINHNEDYALIAAIETNQYLIAVLDGCTMGKESHFAATLIGKILRKLAKEHYYKSFVERSPFSLTQLLEYIAQQLFQTLVQQKHTLALERDELLSTLLLGIVDEEKGTAEFIIVGDGLIHYDGTIISYDHENRPDYLGYHLQKEFQNWYEQQTKRLCIPHFTDLSIATDGIFSFQAFDNQNYSAINEQEWIAFLLQDQINSKQDMMLHQKVLQLEEEYGLKPSDDLSIIRLIR